MPCKKDPVLLKGHTKRCPGPFPAMKNHSKSREQRIASLSENQAAKCAIVCPEKGLSTQSELCWKCRLHIENWKIKKAVEPVRTTEDSVNEEPTDLVTHVEIHHELARCNEPSISGVQPAADYSLEDSMVELSTLLDSFNVSTNDAVTEMEHLNNLLDCLKLPRLKSWNFDHTKKNIVRNSLLASIAAITERFEQVSALFGIDLEIPSPPCEDCDDLLLSMKKRYPTINRKDLLYLMLTCSPKSLSIRKLQESVGCSFHEARLAMELRKAEDHNAFVLPSWRSTGHPLSTEAKEKIVMFYLDDLNTRPSPTARDARYGVHPLTGIRELNAKRLIPVNSSELYRLFCEKYPNIRVHYSKFVKLRPAWCKWPGRFGHHNTCTCMAHENFRSKLQALQYNGKLSDFVHRFMCNHSTRDCYFGLCQNCPRLEELTELAIEIDTVTYEIWKQQNKRMSYITVTQPTDDLIQELQEEFISFTTHHYTTKQQADFIDSLNRRCLDESAIIIKVDFAENYAFNAQNSPTAFHWNNDQATIHPFCVSYPLNQQMAKISYVVVSNTLEHSALSFHLFRSKVLKQIEKEPWFSCITKIYYISDGAGSQYKNRFNFCTLFHHHEEFGLPAEWTFTATAHGKSECDATSGAVKSSAHRAAWAGTTILSAAQLYDYFLRSMTTSQRQFIFADKEELELLRVEKKEQFQLAETVRGTRRFHSVQVIPTGLRFRQLSVDQEYVDVDMTATSKAVAGMVANYTPGTYVVVKSNGNGGIIGRLLTWTSDEMAVVLVMKASGKKNNFTWPLPVQEVTVPPHQFLMKLSDPVPAGRSARYLKLVESDFKKYLNLKK